MVIPYPLILVWHLDALASNVLNTRPKNVTIRCLFLNRITGKGLNPRLHAVVKPGKVMPVPDLPDLHS
jgi:hypothetical protein